MRITKLFGALALGALLAAGVAYAANPYAPTGEEVLIGRKQVLYYAASADNNELTGASIGASDGWKMQITGNTTKKLSSSSNISIDGKNYKSFKLSNGAQNTVTLPEGYIANAVTIYSFVPKGKLESLEACRTLFWKEVDGTKYTAESHYLTAFDTPGTPDVSYFKLKGDSNSFTFTNSGEQTCVVLVVDYTDPKASEIPEGWAKIPGILNKIEESTNNTEAGWTKGGSIGYDSQDGQFGSIKNGGWCSTNFFCDKAGAYDLVVPFKWDQSAGQSDDIRIEITDQKTGKKEIDQHYPYTGGRTDQTIPLEGAMTRGCKTIKFTFTSPGTGYITNIMAPTFKWVSESYDSSKTPAGYLEMPGTLTLSSTYWTPNGLRIENPGSDTPNFGYASEGASATAKVFCKEAGVYSANIDFYAFYSVGDVTLELTDEATGIVEAKTVHHLTAGGKTDIVLGGKITTGKKALKISFNNVGGSFCANFYAPVVTKIADEFASIKDVTVEGIANSAAEGYDWNFLLPETYAGENVVLNVAAENGALTANGEPVVDGKVTIATPAAGQETVVNLALTPNEGAYAAQTEYTVRIFHIGDVQVASLTVEGKDVTTAELLAALNSEAAAATLAGNCYTAVPAVSATMLDGSVANAAVTLEGTTATATFTGKAGDKSKTFTLAVEGVHTYAKAEADQEFALYYDTTGKNKPTDGNWSNGLYTIMGTNDGWDFTDGKEFKLSGGTKEYTLMIPDNIIVKQLTFGSLGSTGNGGKFTSVTSEGADVWLPTNSEFVNNGHENLVVLFDNHQKGTPIKFNITSNGQPYMNFQLVYERFVYTGEPTNTGIEQTPTDKKNHTVVTVKFDRPMQDCVAEYNGKTVKADGGTTALKFSLWDLAWGEETVLTIPVGAAKDVDGNTNSEAITYTVAVAQQPATVDPVEAITYVSNVDELKAAVASVMASNNTADAPRHIIFLKNGDYDLGTSTAEAPILHLNRTYNVSIIGEDRDGVVVHGSIKGISNPVFSVRYSTNTYLENFTIKNDLGVNDGVGVALYGGNRDILVNMMLLGYQDTYVTGEQGYHFNCEIHGSVDYICGGGNHYFDNCTFVNDREGAVICAPSTSASTKWGYVFQNCTVKGMSYNLGRPWQNEPRAYFLNTTMETLAAAGGWIGMGDGSLPTHFYEYNSMDADGNVIDLSTRVNSSTSANSYTPVLTDEEAAEFTVENVLGGDDSWLATEEIAGEMAAPEGVAYEKQTETANAHLWWYPVEGAAGYLIYNNGEYLGYAPGDHDHFDLATNTSYKKVASRADEEGFSYTIRAISPNGTMSAHSFAMTSQNPTGIETIGADAAATVEYYNLQGQPVAEGYRGAVIKVETAPDGSRSVSKAFLD